MLLLQQFKDVMRFKEIKRGMWEGLKKIGILIRNISDARLGVKRTSFRFPQTNHERNHSCYTWSSEAQGFGPMSC